MTEALGDSIVRNGRFTTLVNRHAGSHRRMAPYGSIDRTATRKRTATDSRINALDGTGRKLLYQRLVRQMRTGDKHNARGIFIESMDDATPRQLLQLGGISNQ